MPLKAQLTKIIESMLICYRNIFILKSRFPQIVSDEQTELYRNIVTKKTLLRLRVVS